ncbi:MAG: hypothetical protein H7Z41_08110 [Cytophagales bacterium]|nr:hypothetical protein [Armatimonadota bacterium]
MKTRPRLIFATLFLLGIWSLALSGCGGSGTFRDQDGYIQNPPASPSPTASASL